MKIMVQQRESFGYKIVPRDTTIPTSSGSIDESQVEYRPQPNKVAWSMKTEEARELTKLMMHFFGFGGPHELSDRELMRELKERGYSGKLTLNKEFEL